LSPFSGNRSRPGGIAVTPFARIREYRWSFFSDTNYGGATTPLGVPFPPCSPSSRSESLHPLRRNCFELSAGIHTISIERDMFSCIITMASLSTLSLVRAVFFESALSPERTQPSGDRCCPADGPWSPPRSESVFPFREIPIFLQIILVSLCFALSAPPLPPV